MAVRPLWFPEPERPHRHPSLLGDFVQTQHFPSALARVSLVTSPQRHVPFLAPSGWVCVATPSLALQCVDWPPWPPQSETQASPHLISWGHPSPQSSASEPRRLPAVTLLSRPPTGLCSCCPLSWGALSSLLGIGHSSSTEALPPPLSRWARHPPRASPEQPLWPVSPAFSWATRAWTKTQPHRPAPCC